MSNIEVRKRSWTTLEFSVPSGCVQADMWEAHRAAFRAYCEGTGYDSAAVLPDDAFRVEARDESIVFVVTFEHTEGN